MGLFGDKKSDAKKHWDNVDLDELQKKAKRQWDKVDFDSDEWQKRAKRQWDHIDLDTRDLQNKVKELQKELRRAHRREEPESSSAGFIAGIAVGVLLGAVLSYLFGKQGGSEMVDQFAHRAEGLKESATDKFHNVRDRAEGEGDRVADDLGDGPAIEREFDDSGTSGDKTGMDAIDDAKERVEDAIDNAQDSPGDLKNRTNNA